MEKLLDHLAHNLKAIREERDLSQNVLSERCGLDRTYLGKIERGERVPSLETLEKIASAVDVEPFELLTPVDSVFSLDTGGQVGRLHDAVYQHQRDYFIRLRDMVDREKRAGDEDETTDQLDKIFRHLDTMSELYGDVLSYQLSEETSRVDLSEFAESSLDRVKEMIDTEDTNIDLRYSITPGIELHPNDAVVAVLALELLVDNSYRHAFNGHRAGTVEVHLDREEPGRLILTVTDDGVGGVSRDDFDGSLSGLNIVKQLVTYDLRGELAIDSADEGTEVTIRFSRENKLETNPEDAL